MIPVAICGASGYAGQELVSLLSRHPSVKITAVTSERYAEKPYGDIVHTMRSRTNLLFEKLHIETVLPKAELFFLALPHALSHDIAPQLIHAGKQVIDISGAFRLKNPIHYPKVYGFEHTHHDLLAKSIYGLTETNKSAIAGNSFIANPGCYATATLLALLPLTACIGNGEGIILYIDAKSGLSGAGRKTDQTLQFCEADHDVRPYKIGVHQHVPEIEQALRMRSPSLPNITFVPMIVPMERGILISAYVSGWNTDMSIDDLKEHYIKFYTNAPFIRILGGNRIPHTKGVIHTNYCDINIFRDEHSKQIIIIAAIDNLIKGAAGSAVQNMNSMYDLDETTGLL